jgi:sporulation-control protein spo0M
MGLLDSLKGMVGKGSPKVEVKLLKEQATVQESVKGVATFTGGEYPVTIDSVILVDAHGGRYQRKTNYKRIH